MFVRVFHKPHLNRPDGRLVFRLSTMGLLACAPSQPEDETNNHCDEKYKE